MKHMARIGRIVGLAAAIGVAGQMVMAQSADPANYAGTKSCKMCHSKEDTGNQYAKWAAGPHAKAFERLGTPEAKAAGAKLGVADPQKSGKCLKCHSTAYNWTEDVKTDKVTPEEGVTCESCHGAGKNYKSKDVMLDRAKCIAGGMVYPATKNCALCHNAQSPTWKGSFDAEKSYEQIKHPNPQAKK